MDRGWTPGLPHVLVALGVWPVFGSAACATGLILASLASFVLYIPLTALALNGGNAITANDHVPTPCPFAQAMLFVLWTATAWLAAMLA